MSFSVPDRNGVSALYYHHYSMVDICSSCLVAVVSWCFALPGCSATDGAKTSQHWRYYSESLSSSESLSKGSLDTS